MKTTLDGLGTSGMPDQFEQIIGELGEVTIDGDVANATYVNKQGKKQHLTFRKESGGWRLDIDPADAALDE